MTKRETESAYITFQIFTHAIVNDCEQKSRILADTGLESIYEYLIHNIQLWQLSARLNILNV